MLLEYKIRRIFLRQGAIYDLQERDCSLNFMLYAVCLCNMMLFASATCLMAEQIEVRNSGFEDYVTPIDDPLPLPEEYFSRTWGSEEYPRCVVDPSPIPHWILSSHQKPNGAGTFNPTKGQYDAEAYEGDYVAYSHKVYISQVLDSTLTAETEYTLTVAIGRRLDQYFPGYKIQLKAGDNILAEADTPCTPNEGEYCIATINSFASSDNSFLGQPLAITLYSSDQQTNFDDVRLIANGKRPRIISLCPPFAEIGDTVSVWGKDFGDSQGVSDICLSNKCSSNEKLTEEEWYGDEQVGFVVPNFKCTAFEVRPQTDPPTYKEYIRRKVVIIRGGETSNAKPLEIYRPIDCPPSTQ